MIAAYLYYKKQAKKRAARKSATGDAAGPNLLRKPQSGENSATNISNESPANQEQPSSPVNNSLTDAEKRQKSKARWLTVRLVLGLFFPYFIASTDVTSISPRATAALLAPSHLVAASY